MSRGRYGVAMERFWSKVDKNGPVGQHRPDLGPCWVWIAGKRADGYGRFDVNGRPERAHRFSFEMTSGAIPKDMVLDHLCRNRACVNPDHLQLTTRKGNAVAPGSMVGRTTGEKNRAKTHCPKGHEYTPENTRVSKRGLRHCKECNRWRVWLGRRAKGLPIRKRGYGLLFKS